MTVIHIVDAPPGLGGYLSRWMLEVGPGLFVGVLNPRQRDQLWKRVVREVRTGAGTVLWPSKEPAGFSLLTAGDQRREPAVIEGLLLMRFEPEAQSASNRAATQSETARTGDEPSGVVSDLITS